MNKTMILVAVSLASVAVAVGLMSEMRVASAAVVPASPVVTVPIEPVAEAPVMSRRERMVRIVAEQAAITAEATARTALARKAAERDTASR
ncbi:hypothetical protein [uncultured Nevskia sp.]|uniref:hypothetical protein n=1 Tax=uncultured Nevskia sp. TaxID=228950 RepID=UPI0025E38FC6|nr:hypothetical protein [uncultured Nevskia sp.]